jgi:hypothetical protein
MPEPIWVGAAPGARIGGSTLAHAEAEIHAALRAAGLRVDLVCTHIDRTATVATVTASARLVGSLSSDALDVLAERLDGVVVALDADATVTLSATAVTSSAVEPTARIDAAAHAARAAASRTEGRCVRFPGQQSLVGVHSVTEIVTGSAVDRVAGVGVAVVAQDVVDTGGFLRPQFRSGELVLLVEPAGGGVLRPVEVQHPHECCAGAH